jgi:NADH dehydrogenase/NADH:ubiquinone oxidoreductase subunit G
MSSWNYYIKKILVKQSNMGALTLKNFPFELRRWDIEKFESINPTDSFGCNVNIYIAKNKVIQIEPNYSSFNNWLSDKG